VTSDLRSEVEIHVWPFGACAMKNMQYEYLYSPGNPVATKKEKNKHTNLIKLNTYIK